MLLSSLSFPLLQLLLQRLLQFLKLQINLQIYLLIHAAKKDNIVYITVKIKNIVLENITAINNNMENIIAATSIGQFKSFSNAIDITITASGIAKKY